MLSRRDETWRAPVGCVALLLLPMLASAGPASASDELPLLGERALLGAGWASASASTDGAHLELGGVVRFDGSGRPAHLAVIVYEPSGELYLGVFSTSFPLEDGVRMEAEAMGEGLSVFQPIDSTVTTSSGYGIFVIVNDPEYGDPLRQGVFRLIVYAAGGIEGFSLEVRGAPGTELIGLDSGPDAFLLASRDFEGGARLAARATVHPVAPLVGVSLEAGRSAVVAVEEVFVGIFSSGAPVTYAAGLARVRHPDGTTEACPCFFVETREGLTAPAGEYEFSYSGVAPRAPLVVRGETVLAGAFVRVPA